MEMEQMKLEGHAMTYDEASLEKSKSFVKALQELKNLRPQLYSAAEYCEKSYINSDQKQMVLDNLKDYALQALVNAVDHMGTVAFSLTGIVEQQTADFEAADLRLACINQQVLTCQTYMDKQGLRQQRLLAIIPRHHKRYILPNSVKKVHFSPIPTDPSQVHVHARPRIHPSDTQQKTLSWHLDSETKPCKKWNHSNNASVSHELPKTLAKSPQVFHLLDNEDVFRAKSPIASYLLSKNRDSKDSSAVQKPMSPYRSFEISRTQKQLTRAPPRTKSLLSAFFARQKGPKREASGASYDEF